MRSTSTPLALISSRRESTPGGISRVPAAVLAIPAGSPGTNACTLIRTTYKDVPWGLARRTASRVTCSCGALAAWERIFRYFASRGVDQKTFRPNSRMTVYSRIEMALFFDSSAGLDQIPISYPRRFENRGTFTVCKPENCPTANGILIFILIKVHLFR